MNNFHLLLALIIGLLPSLTLAQVDKNEDGIPVLVRPNAKKAEPEPVEPEITEENEKPEEKEDTSPEGLKRKQLLAWEKSLSATAEALAVRTRALSEREQVLNDKQRTLEVRRNALESRRNAMDSREKALSAAKPAPPKAAIMAKPIPASDDVKWWSGPKAPTIVGSHAIVIDAINGRILHEKDARAKVAVGNLQEMMTALIVAESGALDRSIKIVDSDANVSEPKLGIKAGQSYKREDLVKWLMLKPANDVAAALARDNAGTVDAFVEKMNERGKELGLLASTFKTPYGADEDGQFSTARDMALLAWEATHQPILEEAAKMKSFRMSVGGSSKSASNSNQLLHQNKLCTGMKHGKSSKARTCLVSSGEKLGRKRIVVVLNSTDSWVYKDSRVLLEWGVGSD